MSERAAMTVSQLNGYMKKYIDASELLRSVRVSGEISNLKLHGNGHIYFTLKDQESQLSAVMFRREASKMIFRPENGLSVVCTGRISVYPASGQYQLYTELMESAGVGELFIAYEQLKRKLAAEGLFEQSRKRRIPRCPFRVGLITSPTGAAVRDMIRIGSRRFPPAEIVLFPSLVQGAGAPAELIRGLKYFNETHGADVIIIGRGGGSVEDLWAFNDESLARAVASSAIPVVSAVGHETDFTICDLAADVRASTPSAAAELCFPDMEVFRAQLANVGRALERTVRADIEKKRERVKELSSRRAMTSPMTLLDDHRVRLMQLSDRAERAIMSRLQTERFSLSSASARLQLLDPLAPLARGYAMITKNGRPVVSAGAVEVGDRLAVKLGDGEISVTANEVTYGGK